MGFNRYSLPAPFLLLAVCLCCLLAWSRVSADLSLPQSHHSLRRRSISFLNACSSCARTLNSRDCQMCDTLSYKTVPYVNGKRSAGFASNWYSSAKRSSTACTCCVLSRNTEPRCCNMCQPTRSRFSRSYFNSWLK